MNDLKPLRVWDKKEKKMYHDLWKLVWNDDGELCEVWANDRTCYRPDDVVLLKPTGGLDKNRKKEVYQKDIISYSISETQHYKGVVEWSEDDCGFIVKVFWQKIEGWGKGTSRNRRDILVEGPCSEVHGFSKGNTLEIVILGNELENPELLGEERTRR